MFLFLSTVIGLDFAIPFLCFSIYYRFYECIVLFQGRCKYYISLQYVYTIIKGSDFLLLDLLSLPGLAVLVLQPFICCLFIASCSAFIYPIILCCIRSSIARYSAQYRYAQRTPSGSYHVFSIIQKFFPK